MADKIINMATLRDYVVNSGHTFSDLASPKNYSATKNYCPTKSEILSRNSNIYINGTYNDNQLVCEKDVYVVNMISLSQALWNMIPANTDYASITNNPTVTFKINGTTYTSTYPNVPSGITGTWSFSSNDSTISAINSGTNKGKIKGISSLGTTVVLSDTTYSNAIKVTFTLGSNYGGQSISNSFTVIRSKNIITDFEITLEPEIQYLHTGSTATSTPRYPDYKTHYRSSDLNNSLYCGGNYLMDSESRSDSQKVNMALGFCNLYSYIGSATYTSGSVLTYSLPGGNALAYNSSNLYTLNRKYRCYVGPLNDFLQAWHIFRIDSVNDAGLLFECPSRIFNTTDVKVTIETYGNHETLASVFTTYNNTSNERIFTTNLYLMDDFDSEASFQVVVYNDNGDQISVVKRISTIRLLVRQSPNGL